MHSHLQQPAAFSSSSRPRPCSLLSNSQRSTRLMRTRTQAAAFQAGSPQLQREIKVVGCGSCGVDYLASIATFPHPDQKLRTDALEVQGGGNCANALTAAARLGLKPLIVTKIGGDGLGDGIISELQAAGIDTQLVLRAAGHPSPFTYIIVDRAGGTRTCIHTPGAAFQPQEMTPSLIDTALQDAALVYFDGRLTAAAILLARAARAAGVPVLVEGERLRPGLQDLLAEADYVVTSAHFPQEWTGEANIGDALAEVAGRLPLAKLIISTQGARGSICLLRTATNKDDYDQEAPSEGSSSLQELLDTLFSQVGQQQPEASHQEQGGDGDAAANGSSGTAGARSPACISTSGIEVLPARIAATPGAVRLRKSSSSSDGGAAAAAAAQQAAERAAALNADAGNAQRYNMPQASTTTTAATLGSCSARIIVASASGLPQDAVADTTGAGDAFIGSVLYGLSTGMAPEKMLQLGAAVAACKCTALGARPGLPQRQQLAASLLGG